MKVRSAVVVLLGLASIAPTDARAQTKAGVVTNLEGTATATRSALPQPVDLKFKDDVFQNDRIVTGDRSIVRMLLGGKAVVTVRERSALTITEIPGRSTIGLDAGKVAVAVAKDRMRPGESVEVRTPNAVAAVRGTVFVVEVLRASAQVGAGAGGVTTRFYGLTGSVSLALGGRVVDLLANHVVSVTGGNVTSGVMDEAQRQHALSGLTPSLLNVRAGQDEAKDLVFGTTAATFNMLVPPPRVVVTLPPPPLRKCPPDCDQRAVVTPPAAVTPPHETFPGGVVTPGSIQPPPVISPAFGPVAAGGVITDQYKNFGVLFGGARSVAIFNDPPPAWGGVNARGIVDLISPVEAHFVKPGTTDVRATTNHLSVEVGFAAVGALTLEAFNLAGVLIGSTTNGPALGPHGRTLATLDLPDIYSFRVSGLDTWGLDQIEFGDLVDPPARIELSGPLFRSVNEQRSAASAFLDIVDVAIAGQSADPLIRLSGSTLRTAYQFAALSSSDVEAAGSFARLDNGAEIIQTAATTPLVAMSGGSLGVGAGGAGHLFDLSGRADHIHVDAETGLTLGTDRPIQPGSGSSVFEASNGATVTVRGNAYRVDTALLEATAPILSLVGGASLTAGSHAVDLVGRAKVSIPNDAVALINLNGSSLTLTNGHLVNVAGGSQVAVAGSLLSLTGGSTLSILNGLLLNVTGGSNVTIGRSLVSFSGTGNLLSVTNSLAPTAIIGGIPVFGAVGGFQITGPNALAGLGTAGTIKINGVTLTPTTPLANLTGSLVAIQGTGTVKIGN